MRAQPYSISVNLPDRVDFAANYRPFGALANGQLSFLFDIIVSAENFVRARSITDALGGPAVDAVAEACLVAVKGQSAVAWNPQINRFVGAVVCVLMESNGYRKTGLKRAIKHKYFGKGEVYEEI